LFLFDNPYNVDENLAQAFNGYNHTEDTLLRLERMFRYQREILTEEQNEKTNEVFAKILGSKVETFRVRNARMRIIRMINNFVLYGPFSC
jgi:hypothetical protein